MTEKNIQASMIVEMMGRPAEHLKNTMDDLLKMIGGEKGIKIINKNLHELKKIEPKDKDGKKIEVQEGSEFYSTFSEIEFSAKEIIEVIRICFKYLPSHIELIEPENFEMSNLDFGSVMNDILAKLHNYDSIAKSAIIQNQMLNGRLNELMQKLGGRIKVVENIPSEEDNKEKKSKKN